MKEDIIIIKKSILGLEDKNKDISVTIALYQSMIVNRFSKEYDDLILRCVLNLTKLTEDIIRPLTKAFGVEIISVTEEKVKNIKTGEKMNVIDYRIRRSFIP